jgi:hypothetical protein
VRATIKAIFKTTEGVRLQVSFGEKTAPGIFVAGCRRKSSRAIEPQRLGLGFGLFFN